MSIRDLAEALSLSPSTVSKAINGRSDVNAKTVRRVRAKARQLGYVPDRGAQALRNGRSYRLGLLLPDFANPFYVDLMNSAQRAAQERGFELIIGTTAWDPQREEAFIRTLHSARAEGLILGSPSNWNVFNKPGPLVDQQLPIVTFARPADLALCPPHVSSLTSNKIGDLRRLVEHLVKLGHRRFAYATHVPNLQQMRQRITEVFQPFGADGLDKQACELLTIPEATPEATYQAIQARTEEPRPLPTAVLASNDHAAIAVIAALDDAGFRVPQDISVTGYDNIEMSKYLRPPLTTISQTHLDLGRRAVDLILERIETPGTPPMHMMFEASLVVRQSTGPAPAIRA